MADFIKDLSDRIKKLISRKASLSFVGKESVQDVITGLLKEHRLFINTINKLSPIEKKKLLDRIQELSKDKSKVFVSLYLDYVGKLRGEARVVATKQLFDSLLNGSTKFIEILETINTQLDELFVDKITINQFKLSHTVIFGVLEESRIYNQFSMFLFNGLVHDVTNELNPLPPYRKKAMIETIQQVATTTNRMYDKVGVVAWEASIINMKKNNTNLLLVDNAGKPNTQFITASLFTNGTKGLITSGIFGKGCFQWFGEVKATWIHTIYQRIEQEKEWMESQVALLQLDLDTMNPDNPEYRKMVKVIEAYDDMITRMDKKLNNYYNN